MRDSTIFYRSFYESINELPEKNQVEIYRAIFEYSLNFKLIDLEGLSKSIFTLIKPQLDANIKRYNSGKVPKGKQDKSKTEAKPKRKVSETEANKNKNVNDNDNDNKNINENKKESKKFTPPSLEDVKNYFKENGYRDDIAIRAYSYYSVNDWKDSKQNLVKNWKQKMIAVWFKDEHKIIVQNNYQAKRL